MDLSYSKRSTCKSITNFSINSLKSKINIESMQKNLNPSRSRNIILAKSSSLMNIKIKIKNDNKLFDRLMHTTNFLKKTHLSLKKIANSEDKKHQAMEKTTLALNDELGKKSYEMQELQSKIFTKQKEKLLAEKKYQNKITSTNKIVSLCNNMAGIVLNI